MNQDLMNWLQSDGIDEKNSGTSLLLVPMSPDTPKLENKIEIQEEQTTEPSIEDFIIHIHDDEEENKFEIKNQEIQELEEIEPENEEPELKIKVNADETENIGKFVDINENKIEAETETESEPEIKFEAHPEEIESESFEDFSSKISELNQSLQEIQEIFDSNHKPEEIQPQEEELNEEADDFNDNDKEWQERATGFELSLDEPPPELWTRISPEDYEENSEDDDDELEYEQGMSLQGAAYVPKAPKGAPGRGQNFTERLHQSLRGRKQRAEQLREKQEEKKKTKNSYRSRAVIICATLLMLLGFAYLALWFIQQWTPEKIQERAEYRLQIGDYEGAMNLFQRGYKHYPKLLNFLTGIAKAAESADQVQTATAAWEIYINSLPKDDEENKNLANLELKRLKGEPDPLPEPEPELEIIPETPKEEEPKPEQPAQEEAQGVQEETPEIKEELEKKEEAEVKVVEETKLPAAFYEFLNEANEAYNSELYDTAIIYFHRAMELNTDDIRTYIGLARAYQAKEMFFDAKRILDEAKIKFPKNSTIETQLKILEEK